MQNTNKIFILISNCSSLLSWLLQWYFLLYRNCDQAGGHYSFLYFFRLESCHIWCVKLRNLACIQITHTCDFNIHITLLLRANLHSLLWLICMQLFNFHNFYLLLARGLYFFIRGWTLAHLFRWCLTLTEARAHYNLFDLRSLVGIYFQNSLY